MKNLPIIFFLLFLTATRLCAQIGINAEGSQPDSSAMLDVKSTTKGLLPPRLTNAQRDQIPSPSVGLLIYNTDCNDLQFFNGGEWTPLGSVGVISPPGAIAGNQQPCANSTGNSYSVAAVAGATGYHWTVPPGATIISGQGTNTINIGFGNTPGEICVSALNDCFRSASSCKAVTLTPSVTATLQVSASANPVCAGTTVNFSAATVNGGSSPTYQWKKNNVNITGATNTTYAYVPAANDLISCRLISNALCVAPAVVYSNYITMNVLPDKPVSLTIAASANPVLPGNMVTFTASSVNGGSSPQYQWMINDSIMPGATNAQYTYLPFDGDEVRCGLVSNEPCASGSPAISNTILMEVMSEIYVDGTVYDESAPGNYDGAIILSVSSPSQYTVFWQGPGGWSFSGSAVSLTNCGPGMYYLTITYNINGVYSDQFYIGTSTCGSVGVYHQQGSVAPENKVVSYGTVDGIPGEPGKCWTTRNLGANLRATSVDDDSEGTAGWYWQFNRKQGYKHDGSTLTPQWAPGFISENSEWLSANDPCNLELGVQWRVPTKTEWENVSNAVGWATWNGPWASGLKLHAAGYLYDANGALDYRGYFGHYWSSSQFSDFGGWALKFGSNFNMVAGYSSKTDGYNIRCIRDL
jgi:hypothetical protein